MTLTLDPPNNAFSLSLSSPTMSATLSGSCERATSAGVVSCEINSSTGIYKAGSRIKFLSVPGVAVGITVEAQTAMNSTSQAVSGDVVQTFFEIEDDNCASPLDGLYSTLNFGDNTTSAVFGAAKLDFATMTAHHAEFSLIQDAGNASFFAGYSTSPADGTSHLLDVRCVESARKISMRQDTSSHVDEVEALQLASGAVIYDSKFLVPSEKQVPVSGLSGKSFKGFVIPTVYSLSSRRRMEPISLKFAQSSGDTIALESCSTVGSSKILVSGSIVGAPAAILPGRFDSASLPEHNILKNDVPNAENVPGLIVKDGAAVSNDTAPVFLLSYRASAQDKIVLIGILPRINGQHEASGRFVALEE